MKTLFTIATLMLFTSLGFGQTQGVRVDGEVRRFTLYVPQSVDTTREAPLVLNFHGSGMTALEQMFYTEMNETAEKHGFIVAYPQGIDENWNVGFDMDYDSGSNDIGFIEVLVEKLQKHHKIDAKAIFATGLSRGGFFTHRLAVEMPEVFAAIAPVGAPIPNQVRDRHQTRTPVAMMLAHGDADYIVKYDGKETAYLSAEETAMHWKTVNGAAGERQKELDLMGDETSVVIKTYAGPKDVCLIQIKNGGHTWPGANDFNLGFPLGKTSQDIDFNELMWQFFDANRKQN